MNPTMRSFLSRLSSRKFLATLAVQAAGLIALLAPGREQAIAAAAEHVAAIAAMLLAALGYVKAEADLDAASQPPNPSSDV